MPGDILEADQYQCDRELVKQGATWEVKQT
jgi:hypothetical protein